MPLIVVKRDRQRHEDRGAAGNGEFGDGRGAGARDDDMRPGDLGDKLAGLAASVATPGVASAPAA